MTAITSADLNEVNIKSYFGENTVYLYITETDMGVLFKETIKSLGTPFAKFVNGKWWLCSPFDVTPSSVNTYTRTVTYTPSNAEYIIKQMEGRDLYINTY